MKTSELLAEVAGSPGSSGMLDDRPALVSGSSDQLFSDDKIIRYLNEAEKTLCRDAWVLEDINPLSGNDTTIGRPCRITLVENQTDYAVHSSVLFVKSANLSDTDIDLVRVGYNDNRPWPASFLTDPNFWDINVALTENSGRPSRYSCDMGTRMMRVRRKPDATAALLTLNLKVVRMPLVPMAIDNLDKLPEVPEEYHLDLAMFAAGACLTRTADIDAKLVTLGEKWIATFEARVAKAKRDKQRFQQSRPMFRFGGWVNGSARGESEDW